MKKSLLMRNRGFVKLTWMTALVLQIAIGNVPAQENPTEVFKPGYSESERQRAIASLSANRESMAPPANDAFANAQWLPGSAGVALVTNADATSEPGEPIHGAGRGGTTQSQSNSVWFKFVASDSGVKTIWTSSSEPVDLQDTVLSVYVGSAVNALSVVAECDDYPDLGWYSRVTFAVVAGQTYYVAVDGYSAQTGQFYIKHSSLVAAPNNDFANAVNLGSAIASPAIGVTGTNFNATPEPAEPNHSPFGGGNNSIWYRWTPGQSRSITFSTAGSNFDTVLAVYTGPAVSALTLVAANDDFGEFGGASRVTFFAKAGVPYFIAIDGFSDFTGNTLLNWSPNREESSKRFDFDGDQKADISVFRPSNGQWWINKSINNSTLAATFGASSDEPVPADFTGDGKVDIAVWRPSDGHWYILRSEDSSYYAVPFGAGGDIPVPSKFDNDFAADLTVFRPSTGTWYILQSKNMQTSIQQFGAAGDIPLPADYDGDGRSDLAIYRPSNGQWWLKRSTAGVIAATFGVSTDKPVPGDYTRDGRADIAFWRPSTGEWFVLRSEDNSYYAVPFGLPNDVPAPGDFDGDGGFDLSIFRPFTGTWYISKSAGTGTIIRTFGSAGDLPTHASYVP